MLIKLHDENMNEIFAIVRIHCLYITGSKIDFKFICLFNLKPVKMF